MLFTMDLPQHGYRASVLKEFPHMLSTRWLHFHHSAVRLIPNHLNMVEVGGLWRPGHRMQHSITLLLGQIALTRPGAKPRARAGPHTGDPLLFADTSSAAPPMNNQRYYTPGYNIGGAPVGGPADAGVNNLFADPMASAAMMYGSSLANQGKEIVNKEISRYVSVNKLKYFFAVDSKYVMKKLLLLVFPYTHQDWEVRYHRDTPLTPRHDVNAPDLYIPSMAFITYILLAGMALGIQKRFSPEVLGLCASTALVWVVIEVLVMLLCLYILSVHSDIFDLFAYSGYKYVGTSKLWNCFRSALSK
uniref:protein YIF1A-like isoform X7 n=1 Tax=Oncorhynchus gorbuscha TaxID=8017 RepID=UPI001EAEECB0|nr:protein YIF1A-like isoform X7 [Oncorhynchus gorbuscha]